MRPQLMPRVRTLWIVAMKLIAPMIDEMPVRWMRKIHASTPPPREGVVGQRRVHRPAGLWRLEEHARVEGDPAEQQQPERQRVQPRERHVARPDHERHEV